MWFKTPEILQKVTALTIVICVIVLTYLLLSVPSQEKISYTPTKIVDVPVASSLQPCLGEAPKNSELAWKETVDPCPLGSYKQCSNNQMFQSHPYDAVCPVKPARDHLCHPTMSVRCLQNK